MARTIANKRLDPMISIAEVRTNITRTWLLGAGFSAVVLVVSSILRGRADAAREVWSWFLPLVLPTIGLMIGVLGAAAMTRRRQSYVRKSFADIALWLSVAYLVILSLTILLEPFSPLRGSELHGMSNYWMGPLQGLVVAALGYLFTSDEKGPDGTTGRRGDTNNDTSAGRQAREAEKDRNEGTQSYSPDENREGNA